MKAAYVLPGGQKWPDGPKLSRVEGGVHTLIYEERYNEITNPIDRAFFDQLRAWGYDSRIAYDPTWDGYSHPPDWYPDYMKKRRTALGTPLGLMYDVEHHDPAFILALLARSKAIMGGVNTIWTLENFQAGWFTPELIAFINSWPQLKVAHQNYKGNMQPQAGDTAARDLTKKGILEDRICAFYGLRDENHVPVRIPSWWDGILYLESWNQLP